MTRDATFSGHISGAGPAERSNTADALNFLNFRAP